MNILVYGLLLIVSSCSALTKAYASKYDDSIGVTNSDGSSSASGTNNYKDNDDGTKQTKRLITKYAVIHRIEREVLSCVLKIESNYTIGVISDTEDYGMAQINIRTARMYNLSLIELLINKDYAIRSAAKILSDYRRAFKPAEINTWIARYNIGYQSLTSGTIGTSYMKYNEKIWACIHTRDYL